MNEVKRFSEEFLCLVLLIGVTFGIVGGMAVYAFAYPVLQSSSWAAWVQALGSILAIIGSYFIGARQSAAAHKSALDLEALRIQRKEDGYRGVVLQMIEECYATLVLLHRREGSIAFASTWHRERSPAIRASISAFDSMALYDMGSFERIEVAFRIRALTEKFRCMGDLVGQEQHYDFGFNAYDALQRQSGELSVETDKLKRELNSHYPWAE